MTFESTDLHPSHNWISAQEGEKKFYHCLDCLADSDRIGSGSTGNCIGREGLLKELLTFDKD